MSGDSRTKGSDAKKQDGGLSNIRQAFLNEWFAIQGDTHSDKLARQSLLASAVDVPGIDFDVSELQAMVQKQQ